MAAAAYLHGYTTPFTWAGRHVAPGKGFADVPGTLSTFFSSLGGCAGGFWEPRQLRFSQAPERVPYFRGRDGSSVPLCGPETEASGSGGKRRSCSWRSAEPGKSARSPWGRGSGSRSRRRRGPRTGQAVRGVTPTPDPHAGPADRVRGLALSAPHFASASRSAPRTPPGATSRSLASGTRRGRR